MKKTTITVLVLGALCVLLGFRQDDPIVKAVQQLQQEVADLGLRLDKLEHAGGTSVAASGTSTSAGSESGAAAPARTMVLVSVSLSDHTEDNAQEIDQLKRQSASLQNTCNEYAVQKGEDAGQEIYAGRSSAGARGWRGGASSTVVSTNVGAAGRQVMADRQLENRYSTLAHIKREKLQKLQDANAMPRQILHGHDNHTIFTLETKHDLSDALNDIAIGDTVTWRGKRQSADSGEEVWIITHIEAVK
jgi:hypothetical protein